MSRLTLAPLPPPVPEASPPPGAERYHRLRGLAKAWGVSEGYLRGAIGRGELVCYRLGRCVLIAEEDANRFLGARRQEARR